jgi:hypothetical protein|tara:strand:- start:79 stop:504 length:426 start_codon:yes stop_codon:yes gene_type:complete
MIVCDKKFLEERCKQRGYSMEEVQPCIQKTEGNTLWVDETHSLYPHEKGPKKKAKLGGPGTELHKLLGRLGLSPVEGCKCKGRARKMDEWGPDICEDRINEIVGWMSEEARKRKKWFVRWPAKTIVLLAIHKARKAQKAAE